MVFVEGVDFGVVSMAGAFTATEGVTGAQEFLFDKLMNLGVDGSINLNASVFVWGKGTVCVTVRISCAPSVGGALSFAVALVVAVASVGTHWAQSLIVSASIPCSSIRNSVPASSSHFLFLILFVII